MENKVYQVEECINGVWDIAEPFFSWQVFRTKEDAQLWCDCNMCEGDKYEIIEYDTEDIEAYEIIEM